jgi:5-methylcytosine-specific restriction endonuclease McrA
VAEHIIPKGLGGQTTLENLALACNGCNGAKYTKTEAIDPVNNQVVPLFHPRKDNWLDHFMWNDTCSHIIGLSPTGRATVEALRLNRPNLVSLRRILFDAGKHPPEL